MNASTASILVVDDEPDLRTLYELTLLREGYRVETAASVDGARQQLQTQKFDVVITDMRLPDGFGMDLLHDLRSQQRRERCVVMTAYGSAENAVEALRAGAFDYLTKPVDLKQFRAVVASAVQGIGAVLAAPKAARPGARNVTQWPDMQDPVLDRLIGDSEAMRNVKQRIAKVARSMAPVLVRGESGTGKELVARALHASSQRSEGPLIAVNCGAIPENLLEAEFFGARKGSYTGSTHDREATSRPPVEARCSLTKLATCRCPCNPNCCVRSRSARYGPWAPRRKKPWTCASSAPRTETWPLTCRRGASARICITG